MTREPEKARSGKVQLLAALVRRIFDGFFLARFTPKHFSRLYDGRREK